MIGDLEYDSRFAAFVEPDLTPPERAAAKVEVVRDLIRDIGCWVTSGKLRRDGGTTGEYDRELLILGQCFIGGDDKPGVPDKAARAQATGPRWASSGDQAGEGG
jgi:hypothetical protein